MLQETTQDRYERGWAKLMEVDRGAGEQLMAALKDVSPDLERLAIEFPFGDIYSRPGLDLKAREMAAVAGLTAMNNSLPQLKAHMHAALNVGATPEEIKEVIIQMTIYAGFGAAVNAMISAKEVFKEREQLKNNGSVTQNVG
jgi:4-carboxymuconolactone decarboxylase